MEKWRKEIDLVSWMGLRYNNKISEQRMLTPAHAK